MKIENEINEEKRIFDKQIEEVEKEIRDANNGIKQCKETQIELETKKKYLIKLNNELEDEKIKLEGEQIKIREEPQRLE
jgi:hypothetical protein